ncbi:MAG: hypothetical protein ABEJ91_02370 [Candidatus Nanohaloarchaea archaeon]
MKFQLFGRLRDGEDEKSGGSGQGTPAQGQHQGPGLDDSALGGSGLESTIENMFSQGYSEDEIKQELQGQYPPEKIEDALTNAVANTATQGRSSGGGPEPMTPYQGDSGAVSPVDEGFSGDTQANDTMNEQTSQQPPAQQQPEQPPQQPPAQQQQTRNREASGDVEELVETIVAENLDRVETEFENVYGEIDELKDIAEDLEQRVHDLEVRDDEDNQEFIQKVDEMEEHIDSYQSRIGGLEKAFQQVLPSLVDNVRDLTELVQEIKTERGIETDKNVSKQDIDDIDVEDWD